jgi:insertion element IS1 protein InsB
MHTKVQCPHCSGEDNVVKNGFNKDEKQNYKCKNCYKQFIDRHLLQYKKTKNEYISTTKIIKALERGCGIRDTSYILGVPTSRILKILEEFKMQVTPKLKIYRSIQIDEVWSFIRKKSNKKWLIYAYAPESREILASVIGKRDSNTVKKLYAKLKCLNIEIEEYRTDTWSSFIEVFKKVNHTIGKTFTKAIEGVNCLLRHRVSRLVRKSCCFSKKLKNHIAAIGIVIRSINLGTAWST